MIRVPLIGDYKPCIDRFKNWNQTGMNEWNAIFAAGMKLSTFGGNLQCQQMKLNLQSFKKLFSSNKLLIINQILN